MFAAQFAIDVELYRFNANQNVRNSRAYYVLQFFLNMVLAVNDWVSELSDHFAHIHFQQRFVHSQLSLPRRQISIVQVSNPLPLVEHFLHLVNVHVLQDGLLACFVYFDVPRTLNWLSYIDKSALFNFQLAPVCFELSLHY